MDPTQIQEDKDNDTHSLESEGESVDTSGAPSQNHEAIDASAPAQSPVPGGGNKPSLIRRLWRRLNVYFLLFILLFLIAGGVFVALYLKDRQNTAANAKINSQGLSSDTLKQLANADVSVGTSKQILTVQSNAIFAGAVLVRSNLEVAGALKVAGNLSLPGITVSGTSQFGQVQAQSLSIAGDTNVQGVLTARHGLNVTGDSNFNGGVSAIQITTSSLQLNGDLVLTHHLTAGGPIPTLARGPALGAGGTASVSGSDTAGTIAVNTGSGAPAGCFATLTFSKPFNATPHVSVTPVGAAGGLVDFYVNRSTTSLSVCASTPPPAGQTFGFDYIVLD